MPIIVVCQCGGRFQARDTLAGRQVGCPACGATLSVPDPRAKTASKSPSSPEQIPCQCGICGARYAARTHLAGKCIPCPQCGGEVVVNRAIPIDTAHFGSLNTSPSSRQPRGSLQSTAGPSSAKSWAKQVERLVARPPGGRSLWMLSIGGPLLLLGAIAAFHEATLMFLFWLCAVPSFLLFVISWFWIAALVFEKEGWMRLALCCLVPFYLGMVLFRHEREMRAPFFVMLIATIVFFFPCIPLSVYAIMHPF